MTPSLALFTTCKPFDGPTGPLQEAALCSWAELMPACELLLIGEEAGTAEMARRVGARHVEQVARSPRGTPRMDALLDVAAKESGADWLCYANADILLDARLPAAVARVARELGPALVLVRRINVPRRAVLERRPQQTLDALASSGHPEPRHGGVDVFAYPRDLWGRVPPYLVGRGRWDSGLVLEARRAGARVVDATAVVTAIHPDHEHGHLFEEEIAHNSRLLGGAECIYSAVNATHVLGPDGVRRYRPRHPAHLARRIATAPATHRWMRPLVPIVRRLATSVSGFQPSVRDSPRPWTDAMRERGDA